MQVQVEERGLRFGLLSCFWRRRASRFFGTVFLIIVPSCQHSGLENSWCFVIGSEIARMMVPTTTAPNSKTSTVRSCHSSKAAAASAMTMSARRTNAASLPEELSLATHA